MFLPLKAEVEDWQEQDHAWATISLVVIVIAAHLVVWLHLTDAERTLTFVRYGAVKFDFHWYAPLTCTLLHAGLMHIFGNLLFLAIYGSGLERAVGWWKFLIVYLVGAYVSVPAQLWAMGPVNMDNPVIGASGAIAGVLGAYLVLLPSSKIDTLFFSIVSFRPIHVRIPAWMILGLWFLGQLIYSSGLLGDLGGVAFWAHTAGFVAGAALGTLLQISRAKRVHQFLVGTKLPLLEGWRAWLSHDRAAAQTASQAWQDQAIMGAQGSQHLLSGLIARDGGDGEGAIQHLTRAFEQANDYRDSPRILTSYLQLLRTASPFELAPAIHRDAGFTAQALKQTGLALMCFHYAILTGEQERLDQVLRALEGIVGVKLDRPDLVAQITHVREQLYPGSGIA